jgi:hypothetical protein
VDDHRIRIKGSKDVLERAVLAGQAASEPGSQMSCPARFELTTSAFGGQRKRFSVAYPRWLVIDKLPSTLAISA